MLWETSSNKALPDASAQEAGTFLVHGFSGAQAEFDKIPDQKRAQLRDLLVTAPVVFGSLAKAYKDQEGAEQQVAMLRKESREMFVEFFRMPHDIWVIEEDGSVNVNAEAIEKYQAEAGRTTCAMRQDNDASSDWQITMKQYFSLFLLFLCLSITSTVHADTFPGWEKSIDKKGAIVYKSESESGKLVNLYPPALLENVGAQVWLSNKLSNSKAPRGKWANNEIVVVRQTANLATGH